jgi:hypothetical protein
VGEVAGRLCDLVGPGDEDGGVCAEDKGGVFVAAVGEVCGVETAFGFDGGAQDGVGVMVALRAIGVGAACAEEEARRFGCFEEAGVNVQLVGNEIADLGNGWIAGPTVAGFDDDLADLGALFVERPGDVALGRPARGGGVRLGVPLRTLGRASW